jgi:hypothetical protein
MKPFSCPLVIVTDEFVPKGLVFAANRDCLFRRVSQMFRDPRVFLLAIRTLWVVALDDRRQLLFAFPMSDVARPPSPTGVG